MRKITFFEKLFKRKGARKESEEIKQSKAEMCRKSIQSGVCPNACEICAWNSER